MSVTLLAIPGLPEIEPHMDLAGRVIEAMEGSDIAPVADDIFVFAQKVVSKAEGAFVDLEDIAPSEEARKVAALTLKDPRLVELVLSQSSEIVRASPNVLIVRHKKGYVIANAGIDQSNVPARDERARVLLLPENPDGSARMLRERLIAKYAVPLSVIISDSFGRPWRMGTTNVALGSAGLPSLLDQRGQKDRTGRVLEATLIAVADAIASAAGLVMGESAEGTPVVLVRGLQYDAPELNAASLLRPIEQDLFR